MSKPHFFAHNIMAKQALIVGIDYVGQSCTLAGCANDAQALARMLVKRGYEIRLLLDDSQAAGQPSGERPTREAILVALMELVAGPARELFFSFAGHGSQQLDDTGEEADGKDEVLCPADFATAGMITDDALRGALQALRRDQRLTVVLDCCHSGTGMDLKYQLYDRGGAFFQFFAANGTPTPAPVLLMSGCQDNQTSAEAFHLSEPRGAMTVALAEALEVPGARLGCAELLGEVRAKLRGRGFSQTPQLSAGRACSPRTPFL